METSSFEIFAVILLMEYTYGVYFKYTPHLFSCFWNGIYFKYGVFWAKLHLLQVYYKQYEISILKVYFEYTLLSTLQVRDFYTVT